MEYILHDMAVFLHPDYPSLRIVKFPRNVATAIDCETSQLFGASFVVLNSILVLVHALCSVAHFSDFGPSVSCVNGIGAVFVTILIAIAVVDRSYFAALGGDVIDAHAAVIDITNAGHIVISIVIITVPETVNG